MTKRVSIVKTVFGSIGNVVSTVEDIHGDIAGKAGDKNGNATRHQDKRNHVYGVIKSINGRIGNIVSDFLK